MPKIVEIPISNSYRLWNHGPVALISTTDGHRANACAVAWVSPVSKDPARFMMRIGERHKTYANLVANGELVMNLPSASMVKAVMHLGTVSGHDHDKLKDAGVGEIKAHLVAPPLLEGCIAWLECKLVDEGLLRSHGLTLVEVVRACTVEGALTPDNRLDVEKMPTLHHLGGHVFATPTGLVRGC